MSQSSSINIMHKKSQYIPLPMTPHNYPPNTINNASSRQKKPPKSKYTPIHHTQHQQQIPHKQHEKLTRTIPFLLLIKNTSILPPHHHKPQHQLYESFIIPLLHNLIISSSQPSQKTSHPSLIFVFQNNLQTPTPQILSSHPLNNPQIKKIKNHSNRTYQQRHSKRQQQRQET